MLIEKLKRIIEDIKHGSYVKIIEYAFMFELKL
jgi:hypothetical protein